LPFINFTPESALNPFRHIAFLFFALLSAACLSIFMGGCAQIGAPTGGVRDSLAPVLVKASPELEKTRFTGNKITLYFNEYVELQDLQNNLLISPVQKNMPQISSNLRMVTIKLKDTLQPNSTYYIQFGNAIRDVNEGNVAKDFSYVFSTGDHIDSMTLSGRVLMAETGKADSTLLVLLYRDSPDSAVQTRKPDYATRVKSDGSFSFSYLPDANVKVYALKDGDGSKTYNSSTEIFAFADSGFQTGRNPRSVRLYAFAKEKSGNKPTNAPKVLVEKKLKYTTSAQSRQQDILTDFQADFNNILKELDSSQITLSDTNFNKLPTSGITLDSTRKRLNMKVNWQPDQDYIIILGSLAFKDTIGNTLAKPDTIRFRTKKTTDYGRVVLRFRNLDLSKNPLIQLIQGEEIRLSSPITSSEWKNDLIIPGEYEMRIVFDDNRNGRWDPGDYKTRTQPELANALEQKLGVRADWDNEREIEL
jgi:hypothetical protein